MHEVARGTLWNFLTKLLVYYRMIKSCVFINAAYVIC